jgi:hypothetical protein
VQSSNCFAWLCGSWGVSFAQVLHQGEGVEEEGEEEEERRTQGR